MHEHTRDNRQRLPAEDRAHASAASANTGASEVIRMALAGAWRVWISGCGIFGVLGVHPHDEPLSQARPPEPRARLLLLRVARTW